MCAVFGAAMNTTIRNTREKEFGSMRSLHRGDIYQVRFAPTVFYPSGAPGYVLIMKNDDVILVNPVCNRSKGLVLGQGFRPDSGRCIRIPKRCLRRRVDSISPEQLWAVDRSFYNRYGCRPTESVQLP